MASLFGESVTDFSGIWDGIGRAFARAPAVRVEEGKRADSIEDDVLVLRPGKHPLVTSLDRDTYSAGYLPLHKGPLLQPLGTPAPGQDLILSWGQIERNHKPPVEKFDRLFQSLTGKRGGLADDYDLEGRKPGAAQFPWQGFCFRWSFAALDPEVATYVNEPRYRAGVRFSTAELRGLATYLSPELGRDDIVIEGDAVTPVALLKALNVAIRPGGRGFIADRWNDRKRGVEQKWNQPFYQVSQQVTELTHASRVTIPELAGVELGGRRIFLVSARATYATTPGDQHEGSVESKDKVWWLYIVTDAQGRAIDGRVAKESDEMPDYIIVPDREHIMLTSNADPELAADNRERAGYGDFFRREVLHRGIPESRVKAFESTLDRLLMMNRPLDAKRQRKLKKQFPGLARAFTAPELNAKLRMLGMTSRDFE